MGCWWYWFRAVGVLFWVVAVLGGVGCGCSDELVCVVCFG